MPTPVSITLFVTALLATLAGAYVFAHGLTSIVSVVRHGAPTPGRADHPVRRSLKVLREALGHGRFRHRPAVKVAHWFAMISFVILFDQLVTGYGQLMNAGYVTPLIGRFIPWEWLTELMALAGLLGILVLAWIRWRNRPAAQGRGSRFADSTMWQGYYVEATIALVCFCVIVLRGAESTLAPSLGAWHFPLTSWIGSLLGGLNDSSLSLAIGLVAFVKILASAAWLVTVGMIPTMGVAWHRFLAVVTIFVGRNADARPALGGLEPLRSGGKALDLTDPDSLDEATTLGALTPAQLPWKHLLDSATCTECGRCQDVCPAYAAGKSLNPKTMILGIRAAAFVGPDEPIVGNHVDAEALWDCTTCGACVDACPVDIEHVDAFAELRRGQVLMESAVPQALAKTYRAMESRGNPFGLKSRDRMRWAESLDFSVPVIGQDVADASEVDYLFWVGCAGAADERGKRTSRAVAELLHAADVSFAVLGPAESCTGDFARRTGNEALFQEMAGSVIETLNEAKVTKIVATCAHCFNTLGNEYPQLGGVYQVIHHTELLGQLVQDGRLSVTPENQAERTKVTYHDACYIGRHNRIYRPPRELVEFSGATIVEMAASGADAMCCGAGGGHAFMEEAPEHRVNLLRSQQALETGAGVIATACHYCTIMLDDGVAALREGGTAPQVKDVAVLLAERLS